MSVAEIGAQQEKRIREWAHDLFTENGGLSGESRIGLSRAARVLDVCEEERELCLKAAIELADAWRRGLFGATIKQAVQRVMRTRRKK